MKKFLLKRNVLVFSSIILILTFLLLLVYLNPTKEKAELRRIANINNKAILVTYDFVYDERPEYIGDARVEYVLSATGREQAEIYLPDANEARTVNVAKINKLCRIIVDYAEYTAKVELLYSPTTVAVNFYPSGEIRVSGDAEIESYIYFESKNDPMQPRMYLRIFAKDTKIFPYENGFIIDDYRKLYEVVALRYDENGRPVPCSVYVKIQDIQIKYDLAWITFLDTQVSVYERYIAIMVDTDNDGVFDTDVAGPSRIY